MDFKLLIAMKFDNIHYITGSDRKIENSEELKMRSNHPTAEDQNPMD